MRQIREIALGDVLTGLDPKGNLAPANHDPVIRHPNRLPIIDQNFGLNAPDSDFLGNDGLVDSSDWVGEWNDYRHRLGERLSSNGHTGLPTSGRIFDATQIPSHAWTFGEEVRIK